MLLRSANHCFYKDCNNDQHSTILINNNDDDGKQYDYYKISQGHSVYKD